MLSHILFSTVTFEFQRLTKDGNTVDPSDGLRHGNVRIGDTRATVLRFSSRLLLVMPLTLAFHRLVWGWDSNEIAENQHKFFMFLSLQ